MKASVSAIDLCQRMPRCVRIVAILELSAALALTIGCSRSYYRRQADREVNCLIDAKSAAVGTQPDSLRIDIEPQSRMYDPGNPDCPPMPPDDPTSHELMECVDCKPNAPCWRHSKKTPYTTNPCWEAYLPRDDEGSVVLDLAGAVEIALLNSPDYQQQLETLYLSGLDVTFERFRFDTQFFSGSSIFFTSDGRYRSGTGSSSSLLEVQPFSPSNRLRAEKLTATGGQLVVGLANSLMWQFSGPDNYSSSTVLDFGLVQPLLRAGGRTVVMERLTLAERVLLANVRQMERYRRGFYLNVVTGEQAGSGPSRRGGFFGASGLEGFTGVGGGGFGRVGGLVNVGIQQGGIFTGGAGAQQAGGYLGLLQTAQVIRNQYANIAELSDSVEQLQAAYGAGRLDRFQVDLARQALYNSQSQLLNSIAQYEDNLDQFKVQYGLPADLKVKISDPMLDRFNLLEPDLSALQTRVTDLLNVLRGGEEIGQLPGNKEQVLVLPSLPPPGPKTGEAAPGELAELTRQAAAAKTASEHQFAVTEKDFQHLLDVLPERREGLKKLAKREEVENVQIDADLLSIERLDERVESLRRDLDNLKQRLQQAWSRLDSLTGGAGTTTQSWSLPPDELRKQLIEALNGLSGDLLELSLLQARARLDAITFEPVELTPEEAFCIASRHRPDWMNARAALVDTWRLIAFNADDLQSGLDLVFSGDISNVGDNPLRLRGPNGELRVGLQFDAPLTRLSERNNYRQSLIDYQQARRTYYQFCDRIQQRLRATLRQIQVNELNFELRRAAVEVAITQVDLARFRLSEPARPVAALAPGQVAEPGGQSQLSNTVARDLVDAQISLLNVQNDFLSVWVNQEVQRLSLDFDLGTMELDVQGLRIEHKQPLRAFLENLPSGKVPCERPDACGDVSTGAESQEPMPDSAVPIEFSPVLSPAQPEPEPSPTGRGQGEGALDAGGLSSPQSPPTGGGSVPPHSAEIVQVSATMPEGGAAAVPVRLPSPGASAP